MVKSWICPSMSRVLAPLFLLTFTNSCAFGEDVYSGNHMYGHCGAGKSNPVVSNFTVAYVSGVLNTLQSMQGSPNFPKLACFPQGVTFEQARDIFCKYLDEHPEQRNRNSAVLALAAFVQAFPCPKG